MKQILFTRKRWAILNIIAQSTLLFSSTITRGILVCVGFMMISRSYLLSLLTARCWHPVRLQLHVYTVIQERTDQYNNTTNFKSWQLRARKVRSSSPISEVYEINSEVIKMVCWEGQICISVREFISKVWFISTKTSIFFSFLKLNHIYICKV